MQAMGEIRASTVLPARRTPVTLHTSDGLSLVGELALPAERDPVATLIFVHPLPTHGGMMDSHLLRKAANRLPANREIQLLAQRERDLFFHPSQIRPRIHRICEEIGRAHV